MPTKQNVIDIFLRTFPDASSQAAEYFENAYRWVVLNLPIQREAKTIALVANQWKYDLPAGELVSIDDVILATGVDSQGDFEGTSLTERHVSEAIATGEEILTDLAEGAYPSTYSIVNVTDSTTGKPQIWIWPRYNGTPAGGYPKLVIWGKWYVALAATSTNVPTSIPDVGVIVAKMKQLYLDDFPEETRKAIEYEAEAARKLTELQAYHRERVSQDWGIAVPRMMLNGRRTR